MKNPYIVACLASLMEEEINQEQRNIKACMIEDIIKAQKLAFGFGALKFKDSIESPAEVFDALYDMDIEVLEAYGAAVSAEVSRMAWELTEGRRDEWPRH